MNPLTIYVAVAAIIGVFSLSVFCAARFANLPRVQEVAFNVFLVCATVTLGATAVSMGLNLVAAVAQ